MEFRAQDHHRPATSSLGFNHHQSPAEGRRPLASNTHNNGGGNNNNNNNSTLTSPNSCTNTTTATTQTLGDIHQVNLQPQPPQSTRDRDTTSNKSTSKTTPSTSSAPSVATKYRECLKNHAASVGGSVFDGCGEFMPSGEDGSLEALKCAACNCHRNFHRKEVDSAESTHQLAIYSPGSRRGLNPLHITPALLPYVNPRHHQYHHQFPIVQPMNVAYGVAESSSEELNATADDSGPSPGHRNPYAASKKRFRTKFTAEQKERMLEFAERVGWRLQKRDEEEVERFCAEAGLKRQVLKVWMHNNKSGNARTKQQVDQVSVMMGKMGNASGSGAIEEAVDEEEEEGLD